jgi:hypothetical protein
MASQITKNRTMKMTLRRLLLAISLYTCRILRHAAGQVSIISVVFALAYNPFRCPEVLSQEKQKIACHGAIDNSSLRRSWGTNRRSWELPLRSGWPASLAEIVANRSASEAENRSISIWAAAWALASVPRPLDVDGCFS